VTDFPLFLRSVLVSVNITKYIINANDLQLHGVGNF